MAEESMKDELRAAVSRRLMRQPRNLLSTGLAMEQKNLSPHERRPGLFVRVFRRR
jgi:hypothetical protein